MISAKTCLQVFLLSWIQSSIIASRNSLSVQTQQGVYLGRQTTISGTKVNYWYGIPYAQQPVGNLRWKPAQPLPTSNGIKSASICTTCPQPNHQSVSSSEACLILNVFAPDNATNLPVYVWIHGGGFVAGSSCWSNFSDLVGISASNSLPVIAVSINYRLGFLGFLADQELYDEKSGVNGRSTTGNYGLLDQMMALDWIKKNIRGFGGNPEQITLGGESAGGISVAALLTSPLVVNGTFQRGVLQSGAIWPTAATPLQVAINRRGNILRNLSDCNTVQCLRNLPVDQVLMFQQAAAATNIVGSTSTPVIDDYVLDDIMENNFARGKFLKLPILIGSNQNETSLFTCRAFNDSATIEQIEKYLTKLYNTTIINQIPTFYGPISSYLSPLSYLNTVYSDSWCHCGSRRMATAFSNREVPAYLYRFNHVIPAVPACLGVAHAGELIMFSPSNVPYVYPNYNFTQQEQQLSTSMILYWASFISTSDPNYTGAPTHWDSHNADLDNDLDLNIQPRMTNHYYNSTCSSFWDLYAVTNCSSTLFSLQ